MESISASALRQQAKSGLSGGYLLYGEEEYLKRNSLEVIRNSVLADPDDTFNHIRIDSENYSPDKLENSIVSLPVFAEKKLIEIHGVDYNRMKESELSELASVCSMLEDNPETVLVLYTSPYEFDSGDARRPTKIYKVLSEYLCPVKHEKQTRDKLAKWVYAHFTHNKVKVSSEDCYHLIDRVGNDMFLLSCEIEKLCAYVLQSGRDSLNYDDILLLTVQTKEIGSFDFANAILSCDVERAFYIISEEEKEDKKRESAALTLGSIISVFRLLCRIAVLSEEGMGDKEIAAALKINEYRCSLYRRSIGGRSVKKLEHILELCREADAIIKTGAPEPYAILSRLIIEAAI